MKTYTDRPSRRILLLITNLGKGGAQRVFYDHSIGFSKYHDVQEAVFDIEEDERVYNSGLPLFSLGIKGARTPWQSISNVFKRAKKLKEIIEEKQIEITISHMDGANWVNTLSGKRDKKILVIHGSVLHDKRESELRNIIRRKILIPYLYNKAALTVAVSEGLRYELEHFCGVKNVITIPNYFDIETIGLLALENIPKEHASLFSSFSILITSGRFAEQKKQRYLIPMFKKIKAQFPAVKLVFLGDGKLREELITEIKGNGLSLFTPWCGEQFSNDFDVYMMGYVKNPFAYLSRSTLFLFPSGWEGFPMALSEAMISGVPVLSADCPTGPREILAPGTFDPDYGLKELFMTPYGALLPMIDKNTFYSEWVKASCLLLADENRRKQMIVSAKERMQQYDKAVILQKWLELIDGQ